MSEDAEGIFEGKQVQIVGKRRSYIKIRDKEEGTEKWVDGKRVSISGGMLGMEQWWVPQPKSLLTDQDIHVKINDQELEKEASVSLSLGGAALPDNDDVNMEVQRFNMEKKESSDSDSVLSDSQNPLGERQDTIELPKRRSVTFSPVVMTRDLDTFANVPIPTILGARSDRSNSDLGRGWYTLQNDCLVRETAENHSEHLYNLSMGALVHVTKCAQGQAQINSPCAGWISTGLNGSALIILSEEDIKSRGLDRDVPDMSLIPLRLPDKGISDVSYRSTRSSIDSGMDEWLTKQLQRVEEDIYGKQLSVSLNSQRTDSAVSAFSTSLPPVPDKFDDSRLGFSQPDDAARDSTFSTGTVNEDDLHRSGLKLLQNIDSTRSKGPVRLSDFPPNYDSPALAPIGLSIEANTSSPSELDQKSLTLSTIPSMQTATEKVLDPDPPKNTHSPPTSSLVSLLRDLSSTRKEIQRLQALEQTIVSQVVATFDAITGAQDDNDDADADLFGLLQDTIQSSKKRFPNGTSKQSYLKSRSSESNLLRHGSISKWSQEELDRHEQNLRDQFAMLSPKPDDGKKAWPVSQMKQNRIDKDDLMEQGKDLIMKIAELYNNIDDEPNLKESAESKNSPRGGKTLEKRNSDYNLFRHGSMDKWSNDELERHKQNLRDQVASLAIKEARKQQDSPKPVKKMTKIETMIELQKKRNSDVNLFRPTSMNKWDDSEIERAVDNMQNEMERLHEQMIQNAPTRPKDTDPGNMNASVSLQADLDDVKEAAMRELLEDREVTRARCLSYDSSLLFSDSSEMGEDVSPSPNSDITSPSTGVPEPPLSGVPESPIEDKRIHENAIQKIEQEFDPEDSTNVTSSDAIPPTP